jgi:catechol 2,3-dioxygenase-like lactoylglutathione lyase family enzyme
VFDHVTIRVSDRDASLRFYETVLPTIGVERTASGDGFVEWDDFSIAAAGPGEPVTRGLHVGFGAESRDHVHDFWRAGVEAGFESDGEPGPRPEYGSEYYGGFLLDPDGNSVEAVHFGDVRRGVDHVWIRVANVPASKRFYETVGPHAGFGLGKDLPDRAQFVRDGPGSFSVLSGDHRTEAVHVAFPADHAAVVRDPDGNEVELVARSSRAR